MGEIIACKEMRVGDVVRALGGPKGSNWRDARAEVVDVRWTSPRGGSGYFRVKGRRGHPMPFDNEQTWDEGSKVYRVSRAPTENVGHYGCQAGDRVVKVVAPHNGKPHFTTTWTIECPACGDRHRVRPAFRRANEGEVERAELTLPELPAPERLVAAAA